MIHQALTRELILGKTQARIIKCLGFSRASILILLHSISYTMYSVHKDLKYGKYVSSRLFMNAHCRHFRIK